VLKMQEKGLARIKKKDEKRKGEGLFEKELSG